MDSPLRPRSNSQHSSERRPLGPRPPSPLPPLLLPSEMQDDDLTLERTLVNVTQPSTPNPESVMSPFRRSNHQPIMSIGIMDSTPKLPTNGAMPSSIEPLSIKKKASIRSAVHGSPTPSRKPRNAPLARTSSRIGSLRRVSSQLRNVRAASVQHSGKTADADRIFLVAQTTKEDVRDLLATIFIDLKTSADGIISSSGQTDTAGIR